MSVHLALDLFALAAPFTGTPTPGDAEGVSVDGNVVTASLVGLAALVTAVGGVLVQLVRTNPENVKALRTRVTTAETEVEHLREQLLTTSAELYSIKAWATAHGWRDPAVTGTPDPPITPNPEGVPT